ncbi:MAG: hypothetical protein NC485_10345 [Ruminococcus flavefaciens]|nr:hypothetical protein [Ruminococcus flavefaciens]MCM1059296.1 hypothetical protein [Eubacterium sp.]
MRETSLHHLIFRIITIALIVVTLIVNIFSNVLAHWILLIAVGVCSIWLGVNIILLGIRMGRNDFDIRDGLGFEPLFFLIPIAFILVFVLKFNGVN